MGEEKHIIKKSELKVIPAKNHAKRGNIMSEEQKIISLLSEIKSLLCKTIKQEKIPVERFDKTLVYFYNFTNKQWESYKFKKEILTKLLGFYHSSTPTALTSMEEGYSPIRINSAGKLIVNTDSDISDILTQLETTDAVIDLIKTAIDAIKLQTDKLLFTAGGNLRTQETAD